MNEPTTSNASLRSRRRFFTSAASGLGQLALAGMLQGDGLLTPTADAAEPASALDPKPPHFTPRAKNCIFIYLAGGASQMDLFDPKPKLNEMHGQPIPPSVVGKQRFAFIDPEDPKTLMGSPYKFRRHGQSGMELSELVPHLGECADDIALVRSMHTDDFEHHAAQLILNTGVRTFGRPTIGSWLMYGLGSESANLPGYVVMWAGELLWSSDRLWNHGFLPGKYGATVLHSRGEPVQFLDNPRGVTPQVQRRTLDSLGRLNAHRRRQVRDPQIDSRIAAYELAFRMQNRMPEVMSIADESPATLRAYGVDRKLPEIEFNGPKQTHDMFAKNCLQARRLVERGVRFVNLFHSNWDQHGDINRWIKFNAHVVDQPIAALIKDLKARGLLDSTLVVCAGEFGRTPITQTHKVRPGRDHHINSFSLWLAGGGIQGGQVIGKTDDFGWGCVESPYHVHDLQATLLHLMGINHRRLVHRWQGRDFRLTDVGGKLMRELVG